MKPHGGGELGSWERDSPEILIEKKGRQKDAMVPLSVVYLGERDGLDKSKREETMICDETLPRKPEPTQREEILGGGGGRR